jgi:hypothetical protein
MVDIGQSQTGVFRRGSQVLEHWLVHAEGFEVVAHDGRSGQVERVHVNSLDGRATSLIVAWTGARRSRPGTVVPAETVAAVDPFARRLSLEPKPKRKRPRAPALTVTHTTPRRSRLAAMAAAALAFIAVAAKALGRALNSLRRAFVALSLAAWVWLRPRFRHAATLAQASVRELRARFRDFRLRLRPRLHAWSLATAAATAALLTTTAAAARHLRRQVAGKPVTNPRANTTLHPRAPDQPDASAQRDQTHETDSWPYRSH